MKIGWRRKNERLYAIQPTEFVCNVITMNESIWKRPRPPYSFIRISQSGSVSSEISVKSSLSLLKV